MTEQTPAEAWEQRYAESDRVWSGRVNATVAELVRGLAAESSPGTSLDLGCGEGGDAIWLAQHGWHATGIDLSPTAVARAAQAATERGLTQSTRFVAADLTTWSGPELYDLVTASFLQSWEPGFPREKILRRGRDRVAVGGRMLVLAHAEAPPWSKHKIPTHGGDRAESPMFPIPEGDLAALALDPRRWRTVTAEVRERDAVGPDGSSAVLRDSIVLVQRLA